ncbi:Myb_DNA-binding domain-containing protein [Cephalotus follicularis]|uniref:Myb_DNA-binding domain-containing protein n=1 Tax=Cephalotus follicularis TaxID=3775 RepID=A0A1Q3B0N5_CEPFO|nr:Myb_DNA-binding domain-containing protein [Cephalotus follicularis]
MEFDEDPFGDTEKRPVRPVRAGGRFQPKAKSGPTKETSAAVGSALPHVIIDKPVASDPAVSGDNKSSGLTDPSQLLATDALDSEVAIPSGCQCLHSGFGKSVGENADIFSGLECLDDFVMQSTGGTVGAAIKSVNNEGEGLLSSSETPVLVGSSNKETEEDDGVLAQTSVDSAFGVTDAAECHSVPNNSITQVPVDDGSILIDIERVRTEYGEVFHDFEIVHTISEGAIESGLRARKFQPKPKVQTGKEKSTTSISNSDTTNAQFIPSEAECIDEGSIPVFPPEDVFDYSSINFRDFVPPNSPTSELPVNEDVTNLKETLPDVAIFGDGLHSEEIPGTLEKLQSSKRRNRKTSLASNISQKSKDSSTPVEVNKGGNSLRQLRKRVAAPDLVDEPEDEAYDSGHSPAGRSSSSAIDEGNDDDDDEYRAESSSRKKTAPRKSKKPVAENEKPVRKRNRNKKAPDESTQEAPKKFSHSTRPKKRRVDKVLLQTPEDEIDFQRLPIKDLILLAEYKERLAKKEAKAASATRMTNQSMENSFHEEEYRSDDDRSGSEEFGGSADHQATFKAQPSSEYFNYHTYMNRLPRLRWSKQDTELFYEAVRQFGTDFSMIQQLFPGRTRHQVKLKYKKEQRQQPLKLSEAETTRSKDHSHFEKVIEQLQQAAAEEKQDFNGDDSIGVTGGEVDEMNTETNEDTLKSKRNGDVTIREPEADVAEIHSHLKSDKSDDDFDVWDSYKSEY